MKSGYIYIHNNILSTLLAISEDEQSHGLMGEPWPPPVMSFVYAAPKRNTFWMKNTPSPLDIIFCCGDKVVSIEKGEPYSTAIIGGGSFSDLVIELPFGTASAMGIKIGHQAGLINPTISELKNIILSKYSSNY